MTCCFRSSSKCAIQTGIFAPKTIFLNLMMMVSLMAFLSSCFVFIQFRRGILNCFAFFNNDVLFIFYFVTPGTGYENLFRLLLILQKIHHHHRSAYYIAGFLYQCIYTLQHIHEDANFYLVCRQSRSLTLPLHWNTCRMEHLDHENLSLCVFYTFSTYHGRILRSTVSFSNSCDSTIFQIFLY